MYRRVKDRRGLQVATVATARKMTVLCWLLVTNGEDYAFARPSLNAHKRRKLELESQLHGALDGAMKFVRGDSVAGIVIIIINALASLCGH